MSKLSEGKLGRSSGPGWEPTDAHSVGQDKFIAGNKGGSQKYVYGPGRLWRRGDTGAGAVDEARSVAPQGSRG